MEEKKNVEFEMCECFERFHNEYTTHTCLLLPVYVASPQHKGYRLDAWLDTVTTKKRLEHVEVRPHSWYWQQQQQQRSEKKIKKNKEVSVCQVSKIKKMK